MISKTGPLFTKTSSELIDVIVNLEAKVKKLEKLILFIDPSVSNQQVSKQTVTQWNEYTNCYPEEGV